jgi:thiol-disulfide isomerase/thioredoxin
VKLSDFIGKPVVLNFWASWCPPCKGEMPEFDAVYKEVGEDVAFLMVDLVDGQRETKEKGAEYIKEQGFTFPVYFDVNQDAAATYGIMSIPTTIFIHKDGNVITGVQGAIDAETLRKGIELIKE